MTLDDFQMGGEQMANTRSLTVLTRTISEAIRMELGAHAPIKAPFRKLMIWLVPQDIDPWPPEHDGTVLQIRVPVDEQRIRAAGDKARAKLILDVAEEAVRRSEAVHSWDSSPLRAIIAALRERDDVGWIQLDGLARTVLGSGSVAFFYEVRSDRSSVWAIKYGEDGVEVDRFVVAEEASAPLPLEYFFPVSRSVVRGATVELLTRDGDTLASVDLP